MERMSGTVVKTGAIALALALAGCGGGGGGDSSGAAGIGGGASVAPAPAPAATPSTETQVQRTVQGTAAKGLIKGAKVSVYAIDDQGVRGTTALATATTAADGTYKLQISSKVHDFVVEVTAAPGATMADEATGTDIALPADMKLRSVVTLADGASGTYEGTVSPLTEMVARTAETTDGKLPKQAVAQAKVNVRTLLGFDPEIVKPINSNSDKAASATEDEKNQSLALAAISQMASSVTAECAQGVPGERISCVVKQLAGSVKVKDGQPELEQNHLSSFRDALKTVSEDKKINHTGKDKVVGIPVAAAPGTTPGTTVPALPAEPTVPAVPTVPKSPVEATKALFKNLRTNVQALEKGDAFRGTAEAVKADVKGAILPLGNDAGGFAAMSVSALEQFARFRAGQSTATSFQVWNYQLFPQALGLSYGSYGPGSGDCTITQKPVGITCTTVTFSYGENAAPSTPDVSYLYVYGTRTVSFVPKDTVGGFAYTVALARNTITYDKRYMKTEGAPRSIGGTYSGDVVFGRSGDAISELAVTGRMPGRLDDMGQFLNAGEDWSLKATRTQDANNVALYKFGGVFTAVAGDTAGQSAGRIEISDTSFLRLAINDSNTRVIANAANELQVTLRGSVGATVVDGTLNVSGDQQDKSKTEHMPTKLSFNGSLKRKDATVFVGKVAIARNGFEKFDATVPESDTNFVADTVEFNGTLSVPNRPVLGLTLGATRTGLDTANISAQYRDGASVINASVSAKAGDSQPLVKVSSADGVAFSFAGTAAPVDVTKDGAVVAVLDLKKGMVAYKDGSFESIK
jgi:hypothetical protein